MSISVRHQIHTVWRDVATGYRALRRARGFASVTLMTLALGLGASVAMFSIMHAVLWRPLPYPQAERLVLIEADFGAVTGISLASGEVLDLRASSRMFSHASMASGVDAFVSVDEDMEHVAAVSATDDVLPLLGVDPPLLGRPLQSAIDVRAGRPTAVVISERLWRRMFRSDPHVIGRRVQVNSAEVEIVGVTDASLRVWLPPPALTPENVDLWFPRRLEDDRRNRGGVTIARLRPGAKLQQAQVELDALASRFMADHAAAYADAVGPLRLHARPLRNAVGSPVERGVVALGAAVGFVLLIACVNVTNLMLARAKAREGEVAVRAALGASHGRIMRQLLTEDLVLAVAGCGIGLLIARVGLALIAWIRPTHLPRQSEITIDGTVVAVAIGLSIAATIACGVLPAFRLAGGRRGRWQLARGATSPGGRRLQRMLVVCEVALSIVPLVAAGLLLRTFTNLSQAPLGFDPANIVTAKARFSFQKFPDVASRWQLQCAAVAAVRGLPGVADVSAVSPLPFAPLQVGRRFRADGDAADQGFLAMQQSMLPGYLRVVGIPLVQGRDFTHEDAASQRSVAIVDERLARLVWSGNAIGRRLRVGSGAQLRILEVIGVTPPVRVVRVRNAPLPHVFVPYHLAPVEMSLVVKTHGEVAGIGAAIERSVEALGTGRAVHDVRPMRAYVAESIDETRFAMIVLTVFAAASLLLAGVGLYGTLAYLISQREREFGVRLALGASMRQIVALVAGEGAALVGVGAAVGVVGALAVTRMLAGMLYGVEPIDGMTLAGVAVLVTAVGIAGISRPAWRAALTDPTTMLRAE